jgi:ankyrin repeat protein
MKKLIIGCILVFYALEAQTMEPQEYMECSVSEDREQNSDLSVLEQLPAELMLLIISFLPSSLDILKEINDFVSLRRLSKSFKDFIEWPQTKKTFVNALKELHPDALLVTFIKSVQEANQSSVAFLLTGGIDPNCIAVAGKNNYMSSFPTFIHELKQWITSKEFLHKVQVDENNAVTLKGWREVIPLLSAAKRNHKEIVRLLIIFGADVNIEVGKTFKEQIRTMVETLGEHYKNLYQKELWRYETESLLSKAIEHCDENVAMLLVKANIHPPADGIVHKAVLRNNIPLVQLLIQAGADITKPEYKDHRTPLMIAARWGYLDMVIFLIEHLAHVCENSPYHNALLLLKEKIAVYEHLQIADELNKIDKKDILHRTYTQLLKDLKKVEETLEIRKKNL